jgi:alpha-galactosidase
MTLKIAVIGAGSKGFTKTLVTDCLAFAALRKDTTFSFMDINETRLKYLMKYFEAYKEAHKDKIPNVKFEITTDQRKAIKDAKYIISPFMVGGWEAYKNDLDIPFKYGVTQCIGDTLGPGGVFRFLRSVPVYQEIIKNMREVGYNAGEEKNRVKPLLLNYTNPMAMNTWYCNALWPNSTVGLCHGVQGTSDMLRMWVGAMPHEFSFFCAGINHMAWFLELRYKDSADPNGTWKDAYPIIWEHYKEEPELIGTEKLRFDMMKAFGYFMTESSGHLSEYLPYYRKRQDLLDKFNGVPNDKDSLAHNTLKHGVDQKSFERDSKKYDQKAEEDEKIEITSFKSTPSREYASNIINAMETDKPFVFNGNVMNYNQGLITNLPNGACVEVPITADAFGLHPQGGIQLPPACAALCSSNIWVQMNAVYGALEMNREKIYHAVLLDPNTASVCSPEEVRDMVNEMFEANKKWLSWWKD